MKKDYGQMLQGISCDTAAVLQSAYAGHSR